MASVVVLGGVGVAVVAVVSVAAVEVSVVAVVVAVAVVAVVVAVAVVPVSAASAAGFGLPSVLPRGAAAFPGGVSFAAFIASWTTPSRKLLFAASAVATPMLSRLNATAARRPATRRMYCGRRLYQPETPS